MAPAAGSSTPRIPPGWATRLTPDVAFVALATAVAVFRLVVLADPRAPAGIDGGNWLAFGRDLLGPDTRSSTIAYPPAVPLLVTAAVALLGPVWGIAAVGSLTSLAPGAATYAVLRSEGLRWAAPVLATLVLAASVSGEPAAWGGYPQLLAGGLAILFVWALDGALRPGAVGPGAVGPGAVGPEAVRPGAAPVGGRRRALVAGLLLALVLATSHLVAVAAVLAGGAVVGFHLAWRRGPDDGVRSLVRTLGWVVLPSLPLVPLYVGLTGVASSVAGRDSTSDLGLGDLPGQLEVLYPDVAALGLALMVAGAIAPLLLLDRRRTRLWVVAGAGLIGALLGAALTREGRFLFLLPPAAVLGVGLWLWDLDRQDDRRLSRARTVAVAALVVAGAVQLLAGTGEFRRQRDYYGILTPGVVAGIDWLRTRTPPSSTVAVGPVRDVPLGWWVEGLGRRPTLPATSLRWLYYEDERRRARIANEIFDLRFPSPDGMARACAAGADYALVPTAWAGYSEAGLDQVRAADPDAIVFAGPGAVILRTVGSALCPAGARGAR